MIAQRTLADIAQMRHPLYAQGPSNPPETSPTQDAFFQGTAEPAPPGGHFRPLEGVTAKPAQV